MTKANEIVNKCFPERAAAEVTLHLLKLTRLKYGKKLNFLLRKKSKKSVRS